MSFTDLFGGLKDPPGLAEAMQQQLNDALFPISDSGGSSIDHEQRQRMWEAQAQAEAIASAAAAKADRRKKRDALAVELAKVMIPQPGMFALNPADRAAREVSEADALLQAMSK